MFVLMYSFSSLRLSAFSTHFVRSDQRAPFVTRDVPTQNRGRHQLHGMVVETWGTDDQKKMLLDKNYVVMHLDEGNKQNNHINNLKMGTKSDNADNKSPVTISIEGRAPQTFPSISEAARALGIHHQTIHGNMKRNRDADPDDHKSAKTKTKTGITFTAVHA